MLAMNNIVSINADDQTYLNYEWAVLLFESPWCGSCNDLLKYMGKYSLVEGTDCLLGKVDITQNQSLAQEYNVMSLPTVIIFHKGMPKERFSGPMSEGTFIQKIKKIFISNP